MNSNSGVWTWLSTRRPSSSPDQIGASGSPVENHYTHMMDETYSPEPTDEALYAELDRESIRSGNPSYQNTAYSQCGEVRVHFICYALRLSFLSKEKCGKELKIYSEIEQIFTNSPLNYSIFYPLSLSLYFE